MADVVEVYLEAIRSHDWDRLGSCVTDDLVRVGPFGDTYRGRAAYLAFISDLMPTLPGYTMNVTRVTHVDSRAYVELSETIEVSGTPTVTHEVLVLDLVGDRISAIAIYIQRSPT